MQVPLAPGQYLIDARAFNISDIVRESQRVLVVAAPPDST
jgi:hypothetical protein